MSKPAPQLLHVNSHGTFFSQSLYLNNGEEKKQIKYRKGFLNKAIVVNTPPDHCYVVGLVETTEHSFEMHVFYYRTELFNFQCLKAWNIPELTNHVLCLTHGPDSDSILTLHVDALVSWSLQPPYKHTVLARVKSLHDFNTNDCQLICMEQGQLFCKIGTKLYDWGNVKQFEEKQVLDCKKCCAKPIIHQPVLRIQLNQQIPFILVKEHELYILKYFIGKNYFTSWIPLFESDKLFHFFYADQQMFIQQSDRDCISLSCKCI